MIPLGTDRLRARPPVVTLALIALNVLVFPFTWPPQTEHEVRYVTALISLCEIEGAIEQEYLPNLAHRVDWAPLSCGEPMKAQVAFWGDWRIGNVEGMDPGQVRQWQEASASVEAALEESLYWRWGFRRESGNPFSIITYGFLHAGFLHLFGNMMFLWAVGANVEDVWGRRPFLVLYVLALVVAVLPDAVLGDPRIYSVGASGAVAGVMGAFAVRHWKQKIRVFMFVPLGVFHLAAWWALPAWFGMEVIATISGHGQFTGVAHAAHAVGFAAGALFAVIFIRARVEEGTIGAEVARENAASRRALALVAAEQAYARGLPREALGHLTEASAADPDDLPLRRRILDLRLTAGDLASARRDLLELTRYLSARGDHANCLALLAPTELAYAGADVPSALLLRFGVAAERSDAHLAATLLHRAASATDDETSPLLALKRYAAVLEGLGDKAGAEQARAVLTARQRLARERESAGPEAR